MNMEDLNRLNSPMHRLEENYCEDFEEVKKKKQNFRRRQGAKSPFVVGSIDELNRRIGRLDHQLASYNELVCDSALSTDAPDYLTGARDEKGRQQYLKKEQEMKEMTKFAGIYSLKATFGFNTSERVKKIARINPLAERPLPSKKDTEKGKPKFVELHQFPGFDPKEITPLPEGVSPVLILGKVAGAHKKITKGAYRVEFNRYFYSQLNQALIQDIFWYFFLSRYGSVQDHHYKSKLFNRAAHNYVKQIMYCKIPQYKEAFLNDFPCLMSQALYAAFCEAFPDSHAQFGEQFKEDVITLVYQWFTGIQPAKRLWQQWNLALLEPAAMKLREELMQKQEASNNSVRPARSGVPAMSSTTDFDRFQSDNANNLDPTRKGKGCKKGGSSSRSSSQGSSYPDIEHTGTFRKSGVSNTTSAPVDSRLSPITESKIRGEAVKKVETANQAEQIESSDLIFGLKQRKFESHPACKGPDYVKLAFNMSGQSPLVNHFLRCKNQQYDAGVDFYVQRTEMNNHPPLDAETYQDVIKSSMKKIRHLSNGYQRFHEQNTRESAHFQHLQRAKLKTHKLRQAALLNNPREVKRLSNLLVLEMKRDPDSITFGADAAVEDALMMRQ